MRVGGVERWLVADLRSDAERSPRAIQLKLDKLARDPFTFFRGTLPEYVRRVRPSCRAAIYGVEGVITGDLHLENLGTFTALDGSVAFDLNDFDDAARAPLAIELRRLGASARLATVGRSAQLAARAAEATLDGFELGLSPARLEEPAAVQQLRARGADLDPIAFIASRTVSADRAPARRLPEGEAGLAEQLSEAVLDLRQRTPTSQRLPAGFYEALDAAPRLAGNGSLGRRRYLVLLAGRDPRRGHHALVDFKEPRPSPWGASPVLLGARSRAAQVERVARAFRERSEQVLGTARVHGRLFQVRELSHLGLKVAACALEPAILIDYARHCGAVIAQAWQRGAQPVAALARQLASSGRATLLDHMRLDAERAEENHHRFLEGRGRIARSLGVD